MQLCKESHLVCRHCGVSEIDRQLQGDPVCPAHPEVWHQVKIGTQVDIEQGIHKGRVLKVTEDIGDCLIGDVIIGARGSERPARIHKGDCKIKLTDCTNGCADDDIRCCAHHEWHRLMKVMKKKSSATNNSSSSSNGRGQKREQSDDQNGGQRPAKKLKLDSGSMASSSDNSAKPLDDED